MTSWLRTGLLVLYLPGVTGCGGGRVPTVPVDGRITQKDGRPFTGGFVFLIPTRPGAWEASGPIQPDGTFRLESLGLDGAAPGDYRVRLATEPPASTRGGRKKPRAPAVRIDPRYLDEATSGLTATVPPNGGLVSIRLD